MDNNRTADIKPKISDDTDKIKNWKLVDIVDSANPRTLRLPDTLATSSKVCLCSPKKNYGFLVLAFVRGKNKYETYSFLENVLNFFCFLW